MDSTNRVALDHVRSGGSAGLVAVAGFQRAGRGRHGRTWEAAPGSSLLVSVLLTPPEPPDRLYLASALVALAAADACQQAAGFRPQLKWPNDLVKEGSKLGGILAEVEGDAVVVGLGLNVSASASWPAGAVCAEELAGVALDPDQLLAAFLASLSARHGDWRKVASDYRSGCSTIGLPVRVELAGETFTGTAADVSDEGHLLVDVGACLRSVTAGDVVHLRPFP